MLIKIVAMFRNLLISSFDATIRVKRAFHPAPASRGFASHVFLVIYTKLFYATRWVMLYMKDKLQFFNLTHLQALDFVLLPWPNLHNELYECVDNMQEQFERTSCFKCTVV